MEISEVAHAPERSGSSSGASSRPNRGNSVALDQWRGLALLLVLVSHGFYFTGRVHGIGRVGVNLFFFISGVLVFRSLAKPVAGDALALAKSFWKRRLTRLYPALCAYLVAMFPIAWLLQNHTQAPHSDILSFLRALPFALAYAINYWPPDGPLSQGHLWSLSCEMQFYLLAPVIFLLGGGAGAGRRWFWAALLAALLAYGMVGPFFFPEHKYHFEQAVWPMMLGFCCEYKKDWFLKVPAVWAVFIVRAGLVMFALSFTVMFLGLEMKKLVIAAGAFVFLPCFLAYVNGREMPGMMGRVFRWLGERTYSIYLWQQPLTICGYLSSGWHPIGAFVSVFIGGLWFRWFERPFLSSGRKR